MSNHLIEFLNNNTNNNYPFSEEVPDQLQRCIADIYIMSPTKNIDEMYVESISCNGTTFDLVISDGSTNLFDTTLTTSTSYGDFRTYTATDTLEVRMLVQVSELTSFSHTGPYRLVNNAFDFISNKALSINGLTGNVKIKAGYNMNVVGKKTRTAFGNASNITLNAIAGAGDGYFDENTDCGNLLLRSINGLLPDEHGNLNISGDGCTWIQKGTNTLSFIENCETCLDCNRLDELNAFLVDSRTSASTARTRLENALNVYDDYIYAVQAFKDELDLLKFAGSNTRLSNDEYSLQYKLQTGKYFVTNIEIASSYVSTSNSTSVSYVDYSAFKKLPNQLLIQQNNATFNHLDVEDTNLPDHRFGYWYWTIKLTQSDTSLAGSVDLTWTATIDWEERDDDGTVLSSGTTVETDTVSLEVGAI